MISKVLKSNQPQAALFILFIGILLWLSSFLDPGSMAIPSDQMGMPLYSFIFGSFYKNSALSVFIAFIVVLLQALILVQFNKQNIVINFRTFLPAFFYILISGSFSQLQRINPALAGSIFVFISFGFIYRTYRQDYAVNKLYLAGFFIAIATLFWAPYILFLFIIGVSLIVLRPFVIREWIVSILGFLTPIFFLFVLVFVFGKENQLNGLIETFAENLILLKAFNSIHYSYYILYGFIAFIILLSSYTLIANYQKKKIKNRKFFEINWWIFITGVTMFLVFKNISYELIYLLAIPISFLFTDYFYTVKRNWFLNSILLLIFVMIAYIQIIAHY